uniref:Uncharacterized protein n=1 Tax=Arundo donax TaxID=35708 RepID=A0A0A8Z8W7_ARUDO
MVHIYYLSQIHKVLMLKHNPNPGITIYGARKIKGNKDAKEGM